MNILEWSLYIMRFHVAVALAALEAHMCSGEHIGAPAELRCPVHSESQGASTTANVVDATSDMNEAYSRDIAAIKADFATIKAALATLRTDVRKLLHHFGIASGGNP